MPKAFSRVWREAAGGRKTMLFLFRLVALAALFGLLFGFDEGVIAGALPLITSAFDISVTGEGFMTASVPLGAVAGAIREAPGMRGGGDGARRGRYPSEPFARSARVPWA